MKLLECINCNYTTKIKCNWNRHLKSKKHLHNTNDSLIPMVKSQKEPEKTTKDHKKTTKDHKRPQKDHTFLCDFCELKFSSYAHKRRHELHYCKENTSIMSNKIKTLEKEKKKLETQIVKMMDKVGTINNTTNNIIVVNNYGKENTEYLTVDKIKNLLDRPYDSIQELIKMLHFDSDHPENHNVKITNKKEPYALVWNDPIWELRKKKSVVKDLVDKGYMMIDMTNDNVVNSNNNVVNSNNNVVNSNNKYIKFQDNYECDDNTIKDKIEEETEIVIINESKKLN